MEDSSLSRVGCSSPRGCGETGWDGGLETKTLSLEKDPGRLEPEDEADSTGLGDRWTGDTVTTGESKDSKGSEEAGRPRDP